MPPSFSPLTYSVTDNPKKQRSRQKGEKAKTLFVLGETDMHERIRVYAWVYFQHRKLLSFPDRLLFAATLF